VVCRCDGGAYGAHPRLLAAVNAEDRPVIEGVWNALHHHDAARGPFSYLERNVFDIGRYIAARVTGIASD
jgi:hypothetical protein